MAHFSGASGSCISSDNSHMIGKYSPVTLCDNYHIIPLLLSRCSNILHRTRYCHFLNLPCAGHTRPCVAAWPRPPSTPSTADQPGPDSRLSFAMRVLTILYSCSCFLFHETHTTISLLSYEKVWSCLPLPTNFTSPEPLETIKKPWNHPIHNSIDVGLGLVTLKSASNTI